MSFSQMIAVENGFGGLHAHEKAEWMVGAVDQYFHTNSDLEQYEVEETLQGIMNDEFDTVVEDGSLPLISQQLCTFYTQCRQADTAAVKEKIAELSKKKYNVKANVQEVKADEESSDGDDEAMDCETSMNISSTPTVSAAPSVSGADGHSRDPEEVEQEVQGWTVVRRKKK
ncbi:pre-rRNA-processing protein TSR2 homolog isoform X2 [Mixophyes fleayi]|uniref:pre-rRNA-processing protein TSR2 homolog isoform X2 n=1 Tax=Mixophyes fleayi TaxID=3061075 RepID=UPI003F4DB388